MDLYKRTQADFYDEDDNDQETQEGFLLLKVFSP